MDKGTDDKDTSFEGIRRESSDDKEVFRWYHTIENRGFKMIYNI